MKKRRSTRPPKGPPPPEETALPSLDPAVWRAGFQGRLEYVMRESGGNMRAFSTTLDRHLPFNPMKIVRWFRPNPRTSETVLPSADALAAMLAEKWNVNWLLSGLGPTNTRVTRPTADLGADLYASVAARLEREGWTSEDMAAVFDTPDDLMLWFERETVKAFELWVGRRKTFNRQGKQTGEAITITDPDYPIPPPTGPHDSYAKRLPAKKSTKGGR